MSLLAIAVTLGTPDTAGEVPITTSDLAGSIATALSDINTFAADVIAITDDTYTAHQFGLTASTGLTDTQCNTVFAALNTAITALLASQAIIASANVLVQADSSVATNVAALNGALVSALTFVRNQSILPT